MDLYGHVLCPTCRTEYRIRRRLERGARYRFRCRRCGSESSFELGAVRWACEPPLRRQRLEASEPGQRAPAAPPVREREGHDTVFDARPPVHIGPLVRRGVPAARESSHVSWLRKLMDRKTQHFAVAI